jgi:enoyl-CoA hydratase/carnithine racemase
MTGIVGCPARDVICILPAGVGFTAWRAWPCPSTFRWPATGATGRRVEFGAPPPYAWEADRRAISSEGNKPMHLTSGLIGAETRGPIGWLIWDNPSKLNALSPGMYEDALSVIKDYEADPAIKVVVMRGAGRKAFISGADIKSFDKTRASAEAMRAAKEAPARLRRAMLDLEKPLIAMIYGYCLGGGLGMALNADLRFASMDSQFSVPAALRGVAYAPDGLKSLVDLVGPSVAKDIMFSGRKLKSDEALRVGLINRVVDAEELENETVDYANTLAANAPLSIRASKYFINQLGLERAQRDEARMAAMQREAEHSEDFKEATRSFIEKRKPVFVGR